MQWAKAPMKAFKATFGKKGKMHIESKFSSLTCSQDAEASPHPYIELPDGALLHVQKMKMQWHSRKILSLDCISVYKSSISPDSHSKENWGVLFEIVNQLKVWNLVVVSISWALSL